jgi:DNA polymerase-1
MLRWEPRDLVIDIEVGVEKDTHFDHPDQYQLLCVGLGYATSKVAVVGETALRDTAVRSLLRRVLERHRVVAHNGKFDVAGLWIIVHGTLSFDTMLAHYALDERPGTHGLKYLAVEELGAPQYDLEIKRFVGRGDSYANIPRDVLYKYNAYDVACTYLLKDKYGIELQEQGLKDLHDFLVDSSNTLMRIEMEGLRVSRDHLDSLTDGYEHSLAELRSRLRRWVDNPNSPKQVTEALLHLGIRTSTTNEETLRRIKDLFDLGSFKNQDKMAERGLGEFMELMLLHRREAKLYGTYVKGIRKRLYKGRVHPTFLLHGTVTGRLACRNPNLQNVPRESKIRQLFIPGEGNVFVQGDYAQAELRVVATLAQDDYLRQIFSSTDRDIHGEVATQFFGPGWNKDQRVRAKAYVFGLCYGREAPSIAAEFGIPISEAVKHYKAFFSMIPGVVEWRDQIKRQIYGGQDDLVTHFGRRRRFWLITDDNRKDVLKEGLAFLPQSTASDINLAAANRLSRIFGDGSARLRLLVHDSILVECRRQDAEHVGRVIKDTMERTAKEVFTDYVPFKVDISMGDSWGDL